MHGRQLKFTGGKDIKSESILVNHETSNNERDKDNNFHNVDDSLVY